MEIRWEEAFQGGALLMEAVLAGHRPSPCVCSWWDKRLLSLARIVQGTVPELC